VVAPLELSHAGDRECRFDPDLKSWCVVILTGSLSGDSVPSGTCETELHAAASFIFELPS
jgi:hypothetical protein